MQEAVGKDVGADGEDMQSGDVGADGEDVRTDDVDKIVAAGIDAEGVECD